jgi:predicted small lipoprotein YifL
MSHSNPHFNLTCNRSRLTAIPSIVAVVATVMLVSLLSACGQKGPLFLPGKPEAISTPAKPASTPAVNAPPAAPVSQ